MLKTWDRCVCESSQTTSGSGATAIGRGYLNSLIALVDLVLLSMRSVFAYCNLSVSVFIFTQLDLSLA
ncbi:hypothetical protein [Tumidithrix helvetica]|uniref:hypothetical protein n=1 Tax=Tumidithrix helvetica TaxID=3457545 RepID=UPI003CC6BD02